MARRSSIAANDDRKNEEKVDEMDNDLDQAKGRIKQAVGDLTGNKDLKKEGKADEAAGKVKEFIEDTKDKAEGLVDRARDKVNER